MATLREPGPPAFFATAARAGAVNDAVRAVCQDILGGGGDDTKRVDGDGVPALAYSPKMVEAALPRLSQKVVAAVQALDEEDGEGDGDGEEEGEEGGDEDENED